MNKVVSAAFGDDPNIAGGFHELANRTGIEGVVMVLLLDTGEYESIRLGMDMAQHSHAAAIVQESTTRRIRVSIETGDAAP